MFKTLASAFKNPDLRKKIIITLVLLIVYRVGCFLPVPGIEASVFATNVGSDVSLLTLLNAVSGSALANGAFLALGVTPYINASIIVQLLSVGIPALERLSMGPPFLEDSSITYSTLEKASLVAPEISLA